MQKKIVFNEIALKVLDKKQQELKFILEDFSDTHFLGGGTAISLQIGHRKSIDFNFFNNTHQGTIIDFRNRIKKHGFELKREEVENYNGIENENQDEYHFIINEVSFTCFNFFRTLYDDQKILIKGNNYILGGLKVASLEELLAMKLYAVMTRNKWKDAVDIYFLLKKLCLSLREALNITEKYFFGLIKTGNIIEQLISSNWDKNEKVNYIIDSPPTDEKIIKFLQKESYKILNT